MTMTDREAMLALADPEPDYWDEREAWQAWHDLRMAALLHARGEVEIVPGEGDDETDPVDWE